MVNETKTFAEYKTPKCKVIALALSASCLQVTSPLGSTVEDADEVDYGEF